MTDLLRMTHALVGLHSNTTTYSGTPSTMVSVELADGSAVLPGDTRRVERELMRGDGMDYPAIIAGKALDEITINLLARGVATNDGGTIDAQTDTEHAYLFDSIFGTSTDKSSGSATTITGDTGASKELTLTSATGFVAGGGVLFEDGAGNYVAREIVSVNSNTLTLDRTWTDGAPGTDQVPYGSCNWLVSPGTAMHTHLGIRTIGSNFERLYVGCIGQCSLEVSESQPMRISTRWTPTDWDDASAGTSFSAPTAGDYVVGTNSAFYVNDTKLLLKSATVNFGYTVVPRTTVNGENGVYGYLVTRKQPVIDFTFYFGSSGLTFGEITDTEGSAGDFDFNKLIGLENASGTAISNGQVAATYDVALQVGAGPGRTWYIRMPAAELRGRMIDDNGVLCVQGQALARRPSSGQPCRIHCF